MCSLANFEPGAGVAAHWEKAWSDVGVCSESNITDITQTNVEATSSTNSTAYTTNPNLTTSAPVIVTPISTATEAVHTSETSDVLFDSKPCPQPYEADTLYKASDQVTNPNDDTSGKTVHECKDIFDAIWCSLENFEPGVAKTWAQAWSMIGNCDSQGSLNSIQQDSLADSAIHVPTNWPITSSSENLLEENTTPATVENSNGEIT